MPHDSSHSSRRDFLKTSALTLGSLSVLPPSIALGKESSDGLPPSERVNVAFVGIGNRGGSLMISMMKTGLCNAVAVCDVHLGGSHTKPARMSVGLIPPEPNKDGELPEVFPNQTPRTFSDFRVMFDKMADQIDAVVVGTPDHAHFAITMLAMSLGKHVYVEKPLAHTFGQSTRLMDLAKRSGVVTQMGNQGHSGANYFQFKAWREAGIIKDVTRIDAYMNRKRRWHGWGSQATGYPEQPVPEGLDWDLWQNVVDAGRPFSRRLHPQEWRSWFEYGSGVYGDWGPHLLDTCHRFLDLGLPESITPVLLEGPNDWVYPQASTIRFHFPDRGPELPACVINWYDGVKNRPALESEYTESGEPEEPKNPGKVIYSKDLVFKGGSHSDALQIVPRDTFREMRDVLPDFPQKNSNHYENFLLACKGRETSRSPFAISGALTQMFNLGVLAQRLGTEIQFDRATNQITNSGTAQALLDPPPRKGWEEFYRL